MKTGVLHVVRQGTLVTKALIHSAVMVKTLAILPRIVKTRCLHEKHHVNMTGHAPYHIMTTTVGTYPSPLTTDTA